MHLNYLGPVSFLFSFLNSPQGTPLGHLQLLMAWWWAAALFTGMAGDSFLIHNNIWVQSPLDAFLPHRQQLSVWFISFLEIYRSPLEKRVGWTPTVTLKAIVSSILDHCMHVPKQLGTRHHHPHGTPCCGPSRQESCLWTRSLGIQDGHKGVSKYINKNEPLLELVTVRSAGSRMSCVGLVPVFFTHWTHGQSNNLDYCGFWSSFFPRIVINRPC